MSSGELYVSRSNANGFSHTTCLICSNGQQTVTHIGWKATLIGCSDIVTTSGSAPTTLTYDYSTTTTAAYPGNAHTFFASTDTTTCQFTSC